MHYQKRTLTIRFELTAYQNNQLRALGRTLWPGKTLSRDEVCRRLALDAADQRLVTGADDRLLEQACTPSRR
jgi:hypothetical protein